MKIALIAPADEKVPPARYGGTELVVATLADGLVRQGHNVHLFAAGDSQTKAHLHPTFPQAFRTMVSQTPYPEELRAFYNSVALGSAVKEIVKQGFDIVHNHAGWRLLPLAHLLNTPLVSTMHGPYDIPFIPEFTAQFPEANFISISHSQAELNPGVPFIGNVYNGIEIEKFTFNPTPGDYLAFLGRISPHKGIKEAILTAKAAGSKLIIAAKVDAIDQTYYEEEIKPLIDGSQIQFIGEVDLAGKVALLKNAKALLMLIQWDEPFGLVITEAMATGTPVIAVRRGSTPEIIQDGKTGFLIKNSIEAAVEAIQKIDQIERLNCRNAVATSFSSENMVNGYLSLYRRVILAEQAVGLTELPFRAKQFIPQVARGSLASVK